MKQILHIFWKDFRHYWREIVVSLGLVVAFAWNEMRGWAHDNDIAFGVGGLFSLGFVSGLIAPLVPVAWSFLTVRAIQDESLVGNRQFWVTRPYEWRKLFTAKVLFVVLFVNLPLFIMQLFLLARAGFSPAQYTVGLLWMQMMLLLFFMLPIAALATVTATVVQMLLAALMVVLYAVGTGILSEYIPSSSFSGPMDSVTGGILVCGCLVVILVQYARRETTKSRLILVGLAGTLLLILFFTPYRTLVDREFPPLGPGQETPVKVGLLPPDQVVSERPAAEENNEVQIRMPVHVSGMASGSVLIVSGVLVEIESFNGVRWDSGWKSPGLFLFPEQDRSQVDFALRKKLFERLKSSPSKIRVSLAVSVFHDRNAREFVAPDGKFSLSEVGHCSTQGFFGRIHCLAPLRGPTFLLIKADMSKNTCPLRKGESPHSPGEIAWGWVQNGGSGPAQFGITPVKTVDLYLSSTNIATREWGIGICPGTEVTLSNPQIIGRNQIQAQFEGVRLLDYRQGARVSTTNVVLQSQ